MILEKLNALSNVTGNAKLQMFSDMLDREGGTLLEKVFLTTYNSEINFYQRPSTYHHNGTTGIVKLNDAIDGIISTLSTRKITGQAAAEYFSKLTKMMSQDDAEVLYRIMNRDLKVGISTSNANKYLKNKIPTFNVMLCGKSDEKNLKKMPWKSLPFVQLKSDGLRIIVTVDKNGIVQYRTRNGKPFNLSHLDSGFAQFKGKAFDGEAIIVKDDKTLSRQEGNGILNSIQQGSTENLDYVKIVLWDMMDLPKFLNGLDDTPYETRWDNLTKAIPLLHGATLQHSVRVKSYDDAMKIYDQLLSEGEEGIIIKNPASPYEAKRVAHQIKFKAELEGDFRIIDVVEGTGRNEGRMGNITIRTDDGMLLCDVGTGFTDSDRDWFWANKDQAIDKICTVKFNTVIKSKAEKPASLFLPVFIELRNDKDISNMISDF